MYGVNTAVLLLSGMTTQPVVMAQRRALRQADAGEGNGSVWIAMAAFVVLIVALIVWAIHSDVRKQRKQTDHAVEVYCVDVSSPTPTKPQSVPRSPLKNIQTTEMA